MITAQVAFQAPEAKSGGLRARKKVKTRLAIEDAAIELFERKGYEATTVEEIAEQADVSPTTFFRYFPTKADVLLSDHGERLPALYRAITSRPAAEDDLVAVRRAIQEEWVAAIDPDRTARKAQIVATNDLLRGMSFKRGHSWLATVSDGLAQRRGLDAPNQDCVVAARVALAAMADAVDGWIAEGCLSDLSDALDQAFDTLTRLCRIWSRSGRTRRRSG
jgi:AcrR family transcriptional regulator